MSSRRDEIRARLDAATPGPWEEWDHTWRIIRAPDPDTDEPGATVDVADAVQSSADADLIAHAPEDIAYLLDRVEKYRAQLEAEGWIVAD